MDVQAQPGCRNVEGMAAMIGIHTSCEDSALGTEQSANSTVHDMTPYVRIHS